jgi:hypothetical protein
VYTPGCRACERREKKAVSQRLRRTGSNASGTTVDALTASALLNGWHTVNDDLIQFDSLWQQLTGRQQASRFPDAARTLADHVHTLTRLLAVVLNEPHRVAVGDTAEDCWQRQSNGLPRGH